MARLRASEDPAWREAGEYEHAVEVVAGLAWQFFKKDWSEVRLHAAAVLHKGGQLVCPAKGLSSTAGRDWLLCRDRLGRGASGAAVTCQGAAELGWAGLSWAGLRTPHVHASWSHLVEVWAAAWNLRTASTMLRALPTICAGVHRWLGRPPRVCAALHPEAAGAGGEAAAGGGAQKGEGLAVAAGGYLVVNRERCCMGWSW